MPTKKQYSSGLYSRASDDWETPQWLFDEYDKKFHFDLDPCASEKNHKCEKYFTISDDGLSKTWAGHTVWCNPPYGSAIKNWVKYCYEQSKAGATVVALLPARTDTKWFHEYVYKRAEIRFLKGRLRFNDSGWNAPFPSMIAIFRSDEEGK